MVDSPMPPEDRSTDSPSNEFEELCDRWIQADKAKPSDWQDRLTAARSYAQELYDFFNAEFACFFAGEESPGYRRIRKYLLKHISAATTVMVDTILDVILDKRLRLLDRFYSKYQRSLFGPSNLKKNKLEGFFVRVARIESFHLPTEELPGGLIRTVDLTTVPDSSEDDEPESKSTELHDAARMLCRFWEESSESFEEHHRNEGLVSLGLGGLTGKQELEEKCQTWREKALPKWERKKEKLGRYLSRLLAREESTRTALSNETDPSRRQQLEEKLKGFDEKLIRARAALDKFSDELRPKPKEVANILGVTRSTCSGWRARRITKEINVMKQRVKNGIGVLLEQFAPDTWKDRRDLLEEVLQHSLNPEKGTRGRPAKGSTEEEQQAEKAERKRRFAAWQQCGALLLVRVRAQQRLLGSSRVLPDDAGRIWQGWLADAEDLLELGLNERAGALAGLGRRWGWRLQNLLRTSESLDT